MRWNIGFQIAVWFLVGVVIYALVSISNSIPLFQDNWCLNNWSVVAAIGTWLLAISAAIAIRQLEQTRRNANAQIAVDLYKELREKTRIETLRYIYSFEKPINFKYFEGLMNDEHKENIINVLDQLDYLAVLARNNVINEDLVIEGYAGATVLRCWYQLCDYILKKRLTRGVNLYENLENLAANILVYAKKKHKGDDWILFKPGNRGRIFNIISILNAKSSKHIWPKRIKEQPKTLDGARKRVKDYHHSPMVI